MALFQEIACNICGEKTSMLTRSKLKDGTYVCSHCKKKVPGYIKSSLGNYTLEEFQQMKQYLVYSRQELKPVFTETHSYKTIGLDARHGLFYVEELGERLYLKLLEVESFDLSFEPEKAKEGVLSDKVIGTVKLSFEMRFPYFKREELVATGVKASAARKGIFTTKLVYDLPKGMEEFLAAFHEARRKAVEAETQRLNMEVARVQAMW